MIRRAWVHYWARQVAVIAGGNAIVMSFGLSEWAWLGICAVSLVDAWRTWPGTWDRNR